MTALWMKGEAHRRLQGRPTTSGWERLASTSDAWPAHTGPCSHMPQAMNQNDLIQHSCAFFRPQAQHIRRWYKQAGMMNNSNFLTGIERAEQSFSMGTPAHNKWCNSDIEMQVKHHIELIAAATALQLEPHKASALQSISN